MQKINELCQNKTVNSFRTILFVFWRILLDCSQSKKKDVGVLTFFSLRTLKTTIVSFYAKEVCCLLFFIPILSSK